MKIEGKKWKELSEELKEELLKNATCIDGVTCNEIYNGECIVDLTEELSISGRIEDGEIIIEDEAIIYNPSI